MTKYYSILMYFIYSYRDRTMKDFYANKAIERQLKRMTTHTQITCTIRWEQTVKGMTSRANLCKEFII